MRVTAKRHLVDAGVLVRSKDRHVPPGVPWTPGMRRPAPHPPHIGHAVVEGAVRAGPSKDCTRSDVASSGRNCVTWTPRCRHPLATSWCPSRSAHTVKHPNVALPHLTPQEAESWNNCCPSSRRGAARHHRSIPATPRRRTSSSLRPRRPSCPHPTVSTRGPYSAWDCGTGRRADHVAMTLLGPSTLLDQ
jgi:hypothetical protein